MGRARRLERFLTQPFFTTEQFTGLKGKLVSLEDALSGCEKILRDEFEDAEESDLYMIGTIEDAKAKANTELDDQIELQNRNPMQRKSMLPAVIAP